MIKKLPNSQINFEITISWNEWKKYLDKAAREASEEIKIPGFRPGKAPKNLIEQKVGKGALLNSAAEKAVRKSYIDYVMKENLEVIGTPRIETGEIEEEKDLQYSVTASIMPSIIIGEYKKEIKRINEESGKKDFQISEEDVALELDKLAASRVKLVTVMREARNNDSVEIDFEIFIGGQPIENGKSSKHPLVLGKGVFIPGFEENIIGMREGEQKEFVLKFPENYHKKELAGKEATFKVKLNLVQERQIPEVNDGFAKSLGKFENIEALKKSLKEGMEHENEHRIRDEKRARYIEAIVKNSQVDLPEVLVHEEIHTMIHEFEGQLQPMGMSFKDYLEKLGKKEEEIEKEWEPQAQKRVISALALKKIIKEEKLEAGSKEIEAEMNKVLQYYKNVKDLEKSIDMEKLYGYSKSVLENEKVFEMLEKL